jgi:hypothetical protein
MKEADWSASLGNDKRGTEYPFAKFFEHQPGSGYRKNSSEGKGVKGTVRIDTVEEIAM